MAKDNETSDYRHKDAKRSNIPPARLAGEGTVPAVPKAKYAYSPHLSPKLRFDPTGKADAIEALIEKAAHAPLTADEQARLREALSQHSPWLEWAEKQEQHDRKFFEVDPVALHIHERVSAQAIVKIAAREEVQRDLFADPQQPYREAVQFYQHSVDWANRLILGDSLQVMSSLAKRENLAGQVQMIYMDPPYGIKFKSNFQNEVGKLNVVDRDVDLTREPEMVQAYKDTWTLGTHTYLSYLRARLVIARELLHETGSIFVQTNDEQLHAISAVLHEVFGKDCFVGLISFLTTTGFAEASGVSRMGDYLLWFARDRAKLRSRTLYERQEIAPGGPNSKWIEFSDGSYRGVGAAEIADPSRIPRSARLYNPGDLQGQGASTSPQPFEFQGRTYEPGANSHWKAAYPTGLQRLAEAGRIHVAKNSIRYRRLACDFPVQALGNIWTDTLTGSFTEDKQYVVQTNPRVVERCIWMTTNPGDLVLDPTCGSGTTAVAAEKWGRRWITIDTGRVALAVARQRILTTQFDQYRTRDGSADPTANFRYESVPHVMLRSIARNANLDPIFARHQPRLSGALVACNAALAAIPKDLASRLARKLAEKIARDGKKAITEADERRWKLPESRKFEHWTVPFDTDPDWPTALQDAVTAYRKAWRAKMDEVDACIQANAEQEELVDQPEVVKNVVRVSGPFTVEGVIPAELSPEAPGGFGGAPDEELPAIESPQLYLEHMLRRLKQAGVTFPNNQRRTFTRLQPLFNSAVGGDLHAEGLWEGTDESEPNDAAVLFGPQYGPVTTGMVEDAIRASRRYAHLVIAGFSFDAAATATIQESQHPKLKIHQAYIRPDENPAMQGLLKPQESDQLFTVFGQPEIALRPADPKSRATPKEWVVDLLGVDIYDPVQNVVRSTGADKVAAWFLDTDFDGRCFCITQAFFPGDPKAWEKLAKALKTQSNPDVFEAFAGTSSLPFPVGKHKRIAVKVIDPRGNEVMVVRNLEG